MMNHHAVKMLAQQRHQSLLAEAADRRAARRSPRRPRRAGRFDVGDLSFSRRWARRIVVRPGWTVRGAQSPTGSGD